MEKQLTELIILAKEKDVKSLETLIIKFKPLIKSLARKSHAEYIETDLVIDFIKLIYNVDIARFKKLSKTAQLRYIKTSMQRSLYKNNKNFIVELDIKDYMIPSVFNDYEEIEFIDLLNHLTLKKVITNKQKEIIFLKYAYEESDCKIASRYVITNQAVSKLHRKALQNLQNYLNLIRGESI